MQVFGSDQVDTQKVQHETNSWSKGPWGSVDVGPDGGNNIAAGRSNSTVPLIEIYTCLIPAVETYTLLACLANNFTLRIHLADYIAQQAHLDDGASGIKWQRVLS